jgi:formylglycine-generating enzyme required for sulfatase activity
VEQAAIGNAWWDVAETKQGSERDMLRLRAGFWYRQAEPNLAGGLEGLKIKQRLADLEKLHREAAAQPPAPALAPFDERTAKQHQTLWARHLNVPVVQTNSISMKLVLIPPGEFDMGSTEEEIGRLLLEAKLQKAPGRYAQHVRDEGPRHHVRITKPFCLGVCEVTQTQYQTVLGSNPSKFRGDPSRPVEQVTWHEAVDFCRRLSELPQEKAAGAVYRLPTEAEWEHACRAGTTTRYSFGDAPQPLSAHACWAANAQGQTAPVGRLRPNAWGLLDMHGNVWEWCSDRHGGDYYATSPRDDPTGPEAGPTRVLRGGAWDAAYPGHFRCAYRPYAQPDARASGYGFRVARTVVLDTFPTASVKGQRS